MSTAHAQSDSPDFSFAHNSTNLLQILVSKFELNRRSAIEYMAKYLLHMRIVGHVIFPATQHYTLATDPRQQV